MIGLLGLAFAIGLASHGGLMGWLGFVFGVLLAWHRRNEPPRRRRHGRDRHH